MKKYFTLCIVLFVMNAHAQWTQEKGKGYYKIGGWFLEADQHYTDTGLIDPNITRGHFISSFYGRYGLSNKLTLVGYLPYTQVYQNGQRFSSGLPSLAGESFSSLGDIDFGVEYQLWKKNGWAFSTSLILGLPTGDDAGGSDGSYQTGDGEFNQNLQFNLGKSFPIGKQHFYFKSNLSINQRSKGYSDEWYFGLETGTKVAKDKLLLLGRFNTRQSLQNGNLSAVNNNGSIFANNVEVTNLGGEIIYGFYKVWSVNLTGSFPISGKVIYKAPALSAGIALEL